MTYNHDGLRRLAAACDEGFGLEMWHATEYGVSPVDESEPMIAEVIVGEYAAFIAAANPVAVLALLDELAALKARNAELEAKLDLREKLADPNYQIGDE